MQSSIKVDNGQFILNGKPFFLYSGEIHYFRMPRKLWKTHIEKAKKAGLNTISFYIPWIWHEYEEGKWDFTGETHPQRDLVGFIEMVKKAGLYISARVGPVSNAELINEGIPSWLLKDNPEVYVQRSGVNNLPHAMLLSFLNPTFLKYVKRWYDQLLPIVSKQQVHKEGNIVMVQLCNEIGMVHWLHKAADQAPFVTDLYRKFLETKYKSVSALNAAYGTSYVSFDSVSQPSGDVDPKNLGIFFDWSLFFRRYYALYYHSLYGWAKQYGLEVPLSANIPQFYDYDVRGRGNFAPMTTSLYRDFSLYSPATVFGGAYQMRRLDFENFHDVSVTSEIVRMTADVTEAIDPGALKDQAGDLKRLVVAPETARKVSVPRAPVVCAELQTGILRDRPRLYPSDVELNIKTSAAHGLNGVNCYMFSSGENLPGMGAFGSYHDWQAPVSLDGTEKEHFAPIQDWGKFVKKFGSELAGAQKVTDTALGFYLPYYATEYYNGGWTGWIEAYRTNFYYDGFARLLQLANYNFSSTDLLKNGVESLLKHKTLCVFSLDAMDAGTQEKLAAYVRGGGSLVIGPKLPRFDLLGRPCAILSNALVVEVQEQAKKEMVIWNKIECSVEFPIQTYGNAPTSRGGAEIKTLAQTAGGKPCTFVKYLDKGRCLAYGFPVSHVFDYQVQTVASWMKEAGASRSVEIDPWDVHGVARWGGESGFLFLFNYHDVPKKGKAILRLGGNYGAKIVPFVKSFQLARRSAAIVPLKLKRNKIVEVK